MKKSIKFNDWIKSKFILPTIPLGIITLFFGILNFYGLTFVKFLEIFNNSYETLSSETYNWSKVFSFLNLTFSLFVVFIVSNKFMISNEDDSKNDDERQYFKHLSIKKGTLYTEKKSNKEWSEFKEGVNTTVEQFTWFWVFSWLSYSVIYFLRLIGNDTKVLANLFNNLGSLMFIFLFMTLTISTAKKKWFSWGRFILIVLILAALEFYIDTKYSIFFGVISGLFGGVAIAAFTGAIDSKFANFPLWVIMSLFMYAAIQGFYIILEYSDDMGLKDFKSILIPMILCIALLLKIIMFWGVTWLLRTNKLLFAIFEEGSLNFQREINFDKFNSIVETEQNKLI